MSVALPCGGSSAAVAETSPPTVFAAMMPYIAGGGLIPLSGVDKEDEVDVEFDGAGEGDGSRGEGGSGEVAVGRSVAPAVVIAAGGNISGDAATACFAAVASAAACLFRCSFAMASRVSRTTSDFGSRGKAAERAVDTSSKVPNPRWEGSTARRS